ncbi:MAG: hypothetical protein JXX29_00235 [Deltaproteobacteria bacterium]|nr:hypothetical protein [Deltaproteobacteria bacterium]MBN2670063.1 hypothetical protein [Deltaproteobacteria bacterium]
MAEEKNNGMKSAIFIILSLMSIGCYRIATDDELDSDVSVENWGADTNRNPVSCADGRQDCDSDSDLIGLGEAGTDSSNPGDDFVCIDGIDIISNDFGWAGSMYTTSWISGDSGNTSFDITHEGNPDRWCASGVVGVGEYEYAMMGFTTFSDEDRNAYWNDAAMHIGVHVNIEQAVDAPVRLQIDALGGGFCALLSGGRQSIPWSSMKTECWNDSGSVYDGQSEIVNIIFYVQGVSTQEIPFDFCVTDMCPY